MERFENDTVIFRDCAYANKKLYFFDANNVLPMSLDLENKKFQILSIENINQFHEIRFDLQIEWDKCLYAVEINGEYMCKYQLDTKHIKYFKIDCGKREDANFALLEAYNGYIYIFTRFGIVTIYDTRTEKIQQIQAEINGKEFITGCRYGNCYYMFSNDGSVILEFDTVYCMWKIHNNMDMAIQHTQIVQAVSHENNIYILFENASIEVWNVEQNQKQWINTAKSYYRKDVSVSRICVTDGNIVILPSLAEDIVYLDKQNYEIHCVDNYPEDFEYDIRKKKWTKYAGYCESDEMYYFACRTSNYILEISKTSGQIGWIKSEIDIYEQFDYEFAYGVMYEKKEYLNLMLKRILI